MVRVVWRNTKAKVYMAALIIVGITCLAMIASILFFPQIKIKKLTIDSYWVVVLIGAIVVIASGQIDLTTLGEKFTENSAVNPIKILVLFISMTVLSIFLDELGFFRYLATLTLKFAGASQLKLFTVLYVTVSVLTVFTSNDIIILTFTPFICYFSKNAKINPVPYLVGEFIAANTMSMMFIIGNPTNIYIGTAYSVNFIEYFKVMALPTLASAAVAYVMLIVLFRKKLAEKAQTECEQVVIEDKTLLIIGLAHLIVCTVLLAICSYIGLEMWIISLAFALSLFIFALVVCLIKRKKPTMVGATVKRLPWQLIPFVLSMFVMILALTEKGITGDIGRLFGSSNAILKYGVSSFLAANVINNIPMSVLFCPIMSGLSGAPLMQATYATIVGSNLGAYLTPIGALAGIMWTSLLKTHDVKIGYIDFIKYGAAISLPALAAALGVLALII